MSTGHQLRRDGIATNLAAATAPHRTYRDHAEAILAEFIRQRVTFTADDIHRHIPDGLSPHSPNVVPSLIGTYASQKIIQSCGWSNSARTTRHASRNRKWTATEDNQ